MGWSLVILKTPYQIGPSGLFVLHVDHVEPWVGHQVVKKGGRNVYLPALHLHTPTAREEDRVWGMGLTIVGDDIVDLQELWGDVAEVLLSPDLRGATSPVQVR